MKIIKGDLIKLAKQGKFDVIIHGCNCMCRMGRGIAKQIKEELPEAYEADQQTTKGAESKLGLFTFAEHLGKTSSFYTVNGYTQYDYRGLNGPDINYEALRSVFKHVRHHFGDSVKYGYPKIGAGLAGGDWTIISKIIDEALDGCNHTLVEFEKEN